LSLLGDRFHLSIEPIRKPLAICHYWLHPEQDRTEKATLPGFAEREKASPIAVGAPGGRPISKLFCDSAIARS
jgi:hypothetical protein